MVIQSRLTLLRPCRLIRQDQLYVHCHLETSGKYDRCPVTTVEVHIRDLALQWAINKACLLMS